MKLKHAIMGLAALGLMTSAAACSKVPQGNVGIKVHTLGNSKGPDIEPLPMGRYWIGPTQELHLIETFTKNYVWTAASTEGSRNNEEIIFQDDQGLKVRTDVGVELSIDPEKAAFLFERYRRTVPEIIDGPVRNTVRDRFINHASRMKIEDIYGPRKSELLETVKTDVIAEFEPLGINISNLYWVGEMRIPDGVEQSVQDKVEATQLAIQAENELRRTEADAAKAIAEAKGAAEAEIAAAKGDAEAMKLRGEALRANPEILEQEAIARWDGVLPQVMLSEDGGAMPMLNLNPQ